MTKLESLDIESADDELVSLIPTLRELRFCREVGLLPEGYAALGRLPALQELHTWAVAMAPCDRAFLCLIHLIPLLRTPGSFPALRTMELDGDLQLEPEENSDDWHGYREDLKELRAVCEARDVSLYVEVGGRVDVERTRPRPI